ncbi:discoidin domain-containing protein [Streptococcus iniae]
MKPVAATASSYERNPIKNYEASSAIDESLDTRWASDWKDEESILFDLGESQYVNRLEFLFENNYNAKYSIWVSEDGQDFRQVSSISKNQFQTPNVNIDFPATKARYIKLQGEERANRYGYSIYNVLVTTLIERK